MSKNKQQHEISEDKSESRPEPQNEIKPDSHDRPSVEDLRQTDAILSDIKTDIEAKEVVIDVDDAKNVGVATAGNNVDSLNYLSYTDYAQQIRPPRTTWAFYETGMGGAGQDITPLDYDPSSRNGFVRLVFMIVLIMLLITSAFVIVVLGSENLSYTFQKKGILLAIPALLIIVALTYAVSCSPCTRVFPCNIIVLVLTVICMSVICAWITSRYHTDIVFYALIATCIIVFVCVLLACSSFDFTAWMLYIVLIGAAFGAVAMVVIVGMMLTGTYMPVLHLIILLVSTVLNAICLTMEIQMVLGGRTVEIGEDDYALGAFLLYISIINIFLNLVQTFNLLEDLF